MRSLNTSRGWRMPVRSGRLGLAATLALLTAVVVLPTARAATVPDLSGVWVNTIDESSKFALFSSADRTKLTATWHGSPGPHASLVGTFTGTLNPSGNQYLGHMQVSEGGNPGVGGTMSWILDQSQSHFEFGYPRIRVTYQQANGVSGSFTLVLWLLPARVAPSAKPAVEFEYGCPTMSPCVGVDQGQDASGGAASQGLGATPARARRPAIVGSAHFRVRAGRIARLGFALNKTGRRLLAKRGSLLVLVQIRMTNSSPLARVTNLGIVTFHKH